MASSAVYAKTSGGKTYRGRFGVDRSVVLNKAIARGTIITTPEYVVGSSGLHVYLGGVLCLCGTNEAIHTYAEVGPINSVSNTIQWLQDTPELFEIVIESE